MLPIRRPCMYEKLLLQYYVNNRYSDISWETPTGPFPIGSNSSKVSVYGGF